MIKAFVLLLFSAFIFILHESGQITRFINPNYLYFSQIASVIFLFLFFVQVPRIFTTSKNEHDHIECGPWGCDHDLDEGRFSLRTLLAYGLIIVPLITGFLFPYKDFGAEEALKRGISYSSSNHGHNEDYKLIEANRNHRVQEMLNQPVLYFDNHNFASYINIVNTYPEEFIGKPIELEGFILEDGFHSKSHTVISRFLVTHCVADAHATGLVIQNGDALGIQQNTWIHVHGVLDVSKDDRNLNVIIHVSDWEEIQPPNDPYIYP